MDTNEEKICKEIYRNYWIHQASLINKTGITKKSVKKILDKLLVDKKIISRQNGKRIEFSMSSNRMDDKKLLDDIKKTTDHIHDFVHAIIKQTTKYHPDTLEYLHREVIRIDKTLSYDIKRHDDMFRQDDNIENDQKSYFDTQREVIKLLDGINLEDENALRHRIFKYNNDAYVLLQEILPVLYNEKKERKLMSGMHPKREQILSRIDQYNNYVGKLFSHQYDIKRILTQIKEEKKSEVNFMYEESVVLAMMIKESRDILTKLQKKIMTTCHEKFNKLKQKIKSHNLDEQNNVTANMKDVQKYIDDLNMNLNKLDTSLEKIEIGVITNKHVRELHTKLTDYENWLQETNTSIN